MGYMVIIATIIGYLAGVTGKLMGSLLSFIISKRGKRFQGTLMGFTAGLMIAVVCFDLLPEAFLRGGLYVGVTGILLGVFTIALLDSRISGHTDLLKPEMKHRYLKTGILLAIGVSLHNFPEGMAVGSLIFISLSAGIRLSIIIALHCIPEGIAFAIPLKEGGVSYTKIMFYCFLLAIPMGIGSLIGVLVSEISSFFVTMCLGFAGGVMLFITCGEILPESKEMWGGRLSTIGALIGVVVGIVITANI